MRSLAYRLAYGQLEIALGSGGRGPNLDRLLDGFGDVREEMLSDEDVLALSEQPASDLASQIQAQVTPEMISRVLAAHFAISADRLCAGSETFVDATKDQDGWVNFSNQKLFAFSFDFLSLSNPGDFNYQRLTEPLYEQSETPRACASSRLNLNVRQEAPLMWTWWTISPCLLWASKTSLRLWVICLSWLYCRYSKAIRNRGLVFRPLSCSSLRFSEKIGLDAVVLAWSCFPKVKVRPQWLK